MNPAPRLSFDGIHLSLGRLVAEWSKVELYLYEMFVGMSRIPDPYVSNLLLFRVNISSIIDKCEAMAHAFDEPEYGVVKQWLADVRALIKPRNDMVHSTWVYSNEGGKQVIARRTVVLDTKKGESGVSIVATTPADIDAVTARVVAVGLRFTSLPPIAQGRVRTVPDDQLPGAG